MRQGPLRGLRYPPRLVGASEDVVAKLLGSYEQELHATLADLVAERPPLVVNIGAGEGYYAVGLARALPDAAVVAYDIDDLRRPWCRQLAAANGVSDRVEVRGECTPQHLEQALAGRRALVLCDREGAEIEVIEPSRTPGLARATVIVETHEWVRNGLAEELERRLAPTHDVSWVQQQPRWRNDHPELAEVPASDYMDHELALTEFRPQPMRWLVARPST